jgi:SRSO17 transposase
MARRRRSTHRLLAVQPARRHPVAELVRLAKIRRRIEHDYRELKHGLGLDHFEGRSWTGWHHHVTLVTAAHAFLTEQRLAPKANTADSPSTRSSTPSRTC